MNQETQLSDTFPFGPVHGEAVDVPVVEQEVKPKKARKKKAAAEVDPNAPVKEKRVPRVKGPEEWVPSRPWAPLRGRLAHATIEALNVDHAKGGKTGQFLSAIQSSKTPEEALAKPATVSKDGVEVQEYMDPGYIHYAEKLGLIRIVYAPPAVEAEATPA